MNRRGGGSPNWKPGQSGNPGGRPKMPADVRALAQSYCPEAIKALGKIVRNEKGDMPPQAIVSAASVILDRGYGKAEQTVNSNVALSTKRPADMNREELQQAIAEAMLREGMAIQGGEAIEHHRQAVPL